MRLLLDTQVALWWLAGNARLTKKSRSLIEGAPCAVSAASIWEVGLKNSLGKLPVPPRGFRDELLRAGATVLSVTDEHVIAAAELELAHRDPFDRLIVAVACAERLTLLTADDGLLRLAVANRDLPVREA